MPSKLIREFDPKYSRQILAAMWDHGDPEQRRRILSLDPSVTTRTMLQALPSPSRDDALIPVGALTQPLKTHLPISENYRTRWGRSLDLDRIETAIRSAGWGSMLLLTDLAREMISLDGHASSVLQKRLNRVASLPVQLDPAEGPGVNPDRARDYASAVDGMLAQIPRFAARRRDLAWGAFDGRAALEIEWAYYPGADWPWRPANLHWIHPRRLSFGPQRDVRVIDTWWSTSNFRDIGFRVRAVPHKFVLHCPRLFGDYPEREGLAPRILYWSFFQRFGVRERMILLELFGKPWRIVSQSDQAVIGNDEALAAAFATIEALGGTTTARLPAGYKVEVVQPTQAAGQVHDQAIAHAERVISKLVLGGTATTDAVAGSLGNAQGETHKTEEDLIVQADADGVAEAFEDDLTDAIVALNRGEREVVNAPQFRLRADDDADPAQELANAKLAADIGLPIALDDLRERAGYRAPKENEPILVQVHPLSPIGGTELAPRVQIVWPAGGAPPPGETRPEPSSEINIPGVPPSPPGGPPGQPVPGMPPPGEPPAPNLGDELTRQEAQTLAEKMTSFGIERCQHGGVNRCRICGIERVRDFELDQDGVPAWAIQWRAIGGAPTRPRPPGDSPNNPEDDDPGLAPVPGEPTTIAARLNAARAATCDHGARRRCAQCGVQRSRPEQPWNVIAQ